MKAGKNRRKVNLNLFFQNVTLTLLYKLNLLLPLNNIVFHWIFLYSSKRINLKINVLLFLTENPFVFSNCSSYANSFLLLFNNFHCIISSFLHCFYRNTWGFKNRIILINVLIVAFVILKWLIKNTCDWYVHKFGRFQYFNIFILILIYCFCSCTF